MSPCSLLSIEPWWLALDHVLSLIARRIWQLNTPTSLLHTLVLPVFSPHHLADNCPYGYGVCVCVCVFLSVIESSSHNFRFILSSLSVYIQSWSIRLGLVLFQAGFFNGSEARSIFKALFARHLLKSATLGSTNTKACSFNRLSLCQWCEHTNISGTKVCLPPFHEHCAHSLCCSCWRWRLLKSCPIPHSTTIPAYPSFYQ